MTYIKLVLWAFWGHLVLVNFVYGQNIIANPSFEIVQSGVQYPNNYAQADNLDKWETRKYQNGSTVLHSPDWYFGNFVNPPFPSSPSGSPRSGSGFVGLDVNELIQQKLPQKPQAHILYTLVVYIKPMVYYSNKNYEVQFLFSREKMCYESENSLEAYINCYDSYKKTQSCVAPNINPIEKFSYYIYTNQPNYNDYIKIEIPLKSDLSEYDWFGIDIKDIDGGSCGGSYFLIDDVSLEYDCCAPYQLYQAFDNLPTITQRKNFIRAGYNVGASYQSPGNVIVKANQKVKFRSGGYISLEPGFIVEPGAVFVGEINDCTYDEEDFVDYNIKLDYYDQLSMLDCSNNYWHQSYPFHLSLNAAFYSKGATHYHVQLLNGWGQKIYDKMDYISTLITVFWNGTGSATADPSEVAVVQLRLYNCQDNILKTYSLAYEYNGCSPGAKKEWEEPMTYYESNREENKTSVKVFPNPFSKDIFVETLGLEQEFLEYRILNSHGQMLMNSSFNLSKSRNEIFKIETNNLATGHYILQAQVNGYSKSFPIIKIMNE